MKVIVRTKVDICVFIFFSLSELLLEYELEKINNIRLNNI